jgi:predicted phosphoribosyltransferase
LEPENVMSNQQQPMSVFTSDELRTIQFHDRADAGRQLAATLKHQRGRNALVLAISNGGIPIGVEIAKSLDCELDVIAARKLRLAGQPAIMLGAVTEDGTTAFNHAVLLGLGLASPCLDQLVSEESAEAQCEALRLRRGLPPQRWSGRPVILTDDGIVTGATMRAAIQSLRERQPSEIVVAVPVATTQLAEALARDVEEFICLRRSSAGTLLSEHYRNFARISDESIEIALCEQRSPRTR